MMCMPLHSYKLCSKLLSKWVISKIIWGSIIGVVKGDTRSLNYGSYVGLFLSEYQNRPTI